VTPLVTTPPPAEPEAEAEPELEPTLPQQLEPEPAASPHTPGHSGAASALLSETGSQPVLSGFAPLVKGQLLAERYRLAALVGREAHASLWQATDEVLARSVLIAALEDEETADSVVQAARQSTAATDARFVRVLDAVADAEGFYIISEWVDGTPLSQVLQAGPLTAVESAWVTKEVAEALTTIHPLKVFHQRLDPTRILITASGGIRISGLTTAAALNPRDGDDELTREDLERQDVRDLGRLLYACETGAWPGPEPVGLPEAPQVDGVYTTPLRLQPAVNPALDRITDQIMADAPRADRPRLATAAAVLKALTQVLGPADSSDDLAHRLVLAANSPALSPAQVTGAASPAAAPAGPVGEPEAPDGDLSVGPVRPAAGPAASLRSRRPWAIGLVILIVLVVIALLAVLITKGFNQNKADDDNPAAEQTAQADPSAAGIAPLAIAAAYAFDPFGSGLENDDQLDYAHDGLASTAWLTEDYPGPTFTNAAGDPKAGVGLVVDLGQAKALRDIKVTLAADPTPVTFYVPADPDASEPILDGLTGWKAVANVGRPQPTAGTAPSRDLDVTVSTTARFVLVFVHDGLPLLDGHYQTGIAEIQVLG
jgi:putative peptidoglycan lipid II flippase